MRWRKCQIEAKDNEIDRLREALLGIESIMTDRTFKLDQDLELTEGDEFTETNIRIAEVNLISEKIGGLLKALQSKGGRDD
jgi:hypothetical protein